MTRLRCGNPRSGWSRTAPVCAASRSRRDDHRSDPGDPGFTLIEVVVSLFLLAVVSTAALGLFVRSLATGDLQDQRQQAVELANLQLESVRALNPKNLTDGRTQAAVDAILDDTSVNWAVTGVDDVTATPTTHRLFDPSATSSSTQLVPTVKTVTLNAMTYTITTFVDRCWESAASTAGSCGPTQGSLPSSAAMVRATVLVTWTPGRNQTCNTAHGCAYLARTLVDANPNPTFTRSG